MVQLNAVTKAKAIKNCLDYLSEEADQADLTEVALFIGAAAEAAADAALRLEEHGSRRLVAVPTVRATAPADRQA
ncbi:MAG: hypothetical protein IH999_01125 [Proteobacteria bacterium]|nr:hypothetical protein [Pseudomonadota bacterium]